MNFNSSQFLENKNKETLWDIMFQNGFFNNQKQKPEYIKQFLETTMNTIENSNVNNSLLEKNKLTLIQIKKYLDENKKEQHELITAEQITKHRETIFLNNLNDKINEYKSFNKQIKPKNIDFSDKNDDKIEDVNNLLEQALNNRKKLNKEISIINTVNSVNKNTLLNIGEIINDNSNKDIEVINNKIEPKSDKVLIEIEKKYDLIIDLLNKILTSINNKDV